ncbi:DUF3240 family protein [Helicobacter labacensis]|uniref:DUF3240 family protein n=1 Tax=Helicobacter labacensis TaxID=2316079 RepID=UPI001F1CF505|nr:DUF3240 family protein [Helicobacter labacensis]
MFLDIYAPARQTEMLTDYLLEQGYSDFYLSACFQYGATNLLKSPKEQVSGRKDYAHLRLCLPEENARSLAQEIKARCAPSAIYLISVTAL